MNRSSLLLTLAGVAGLLFFWLTDPKWGPVALPPDRVKDERASMVDRARAELAPQTIDAATDAAAGTVVGLIGSAVVTGVGLWLVTRKTA